MKRLMQAGLSAALAFSFIGCSDLPGTKGQQGAVAGGVGGAAVGAAVTKNRALGAIIGGAAGAAGGYVIGQNSDKILGKDKTAAEEAARKSEANPATPEAVRNSTTADLNKDGFVTLDEVVAMKNAGLSDDQMVDRLRATGQVFDLNTDQRRYLTDRGVSPSLVDRMVTIKASGNNEVIGRDPSRTAYPQ
jgi:hypothetical protein